MLFYNFDLLDNFVKSNFIANLKTERNSIMQYIDLYHNKKINLSSITTNMIETISLIDEDNLSNFKQTIQDLKTAFENIEIIENLANNLEKDLTSTIALYDKSLENNANEIKANLVEYNKQKERLLTKIFEFENTNTIVLNSAIQISLNSHKKNKKPDFKAFENDIPKIDVEVNPVDNNVLIISEKEQKAYLPFYYSEIEKIYKDSNNRYATLQDVVNDLYIIPLSRFKNSSLSRLRECFHLIREKENSSTYKALDLGLELMFNYKLNPIIIAACRNLDELDIYLDCLETNQLYDFKCFEIKFEVLPKITNKK